MITLSELIESLQELDQNMYVESMELVDIDGQEYLYDDLNSESEMVS